MKCALIKIFSEEKELTIKTMEELEIGDKVIINNITDSFIVYGTVLMLETCSKDQKCAATLVKKVSVKEYQDYLIKMQLLKKEIRNIIIQEKLNMHVVLVVKSCDSKKLKIIYTSEERVDFRDFLKLLSNKYKLKIELKQIGVRDKAKIIGGYGVCGQVQCCCRLNKKLDNININMAKKQNIALSPNKINGNCGRLLCCLRYELENGEYYGGD